MEFQTAADALETRKNILHLTTGSVEIDKLLEGGIETGSITEVVSRTFLFTKSFSFVCGLYGLMIIKLFFISP